MGVVDLVKIQQIKSELAALAKQHPELCQGGGSWSNHLEELNDMVTMTGKERMEKYREKQRQKGLKAVNIFLTQEAQRVLHSLLSKRPDATMGEIISEALVDKEIKP